MKTILQRKLSGVKDSELTGYILKYSIAGMLTLIAGWGFYIAIYAAFVAFGGD